MRKVIAWALALPDAFKPPDVKDVPGLGGHGVWLGADFNLYLQEPTKTNPQQDGGRVTTSSDKTVD